MWNMTDDSSAHGRQGFNHSWRHTPPGSGSRMSLSLINRKMDSVIGAYNTPKSSGLSRILGPGTPGLTEPTNGELAHGIIANYLLKECAEFRKVSELREKGWNNPAGDTFFKKQRQSSDKADNRTAEFFFQMMKDIGEELHRSTNAFQIRSTRAKILDMCMAPGGFLATALCKNPLAEALAFSLPVANGGHRVLLPATSNIEEKFLDITMLAEDMGIDEIPSNHPDAGHFLPRQFKPDQLFDLVLCDGQVLRTHERASYRENREAKRLITTQLALGMEHLRPGGTMVVLLHKLERCDTASLVWKFSKFSSVRCLKPQKGHRIRSSFYMVATNIQSQHPNAVEATKTWKTTYEVATLGTDEEYEQLLRDNGEGVEEMITEFGVDLVNMGRQVWRVQADALSKASFIHS
ncbi:hypothetical protein GGR54DRAFT_354786 [Hypoxylon sp. NC1633]|nr:hypothetical protein GGR54DRAFT_354786 [Hypoxylon sp. NC1633]